MHESTAKIPSKCSLSLAAILSAKANAPPPAAARSIGLQMAERSRISKEDLVQVAVECRNVKKVLRQLEGLSDQESVVDLGGDFLSATVRASTVKAFLDHDEVTRVQSKKRSRLHLNLASRDVGLLKPAPATTRQVAETGKGVTIGVIDSGFDLSHPMFRDANGKLRVDGLLDQSLPVAKEFNPVALEAGWASGANPGRDENGHGTHVAGIAGGTRFNDVEGVAPGARYLLVKTDFFNTDDAIAWIFRKAGATPCVVNMSLGHHFGAHDGTDAEERLHNRLTGPGKLVVISAGNEREDEIHLGGRFSSGQTASAGIEIERDPSGESSATITLWYDARDTFEFELVSPTGNVMPIPRIGQQKSFSANRLRVNLLRGAYPISGLVQAQLQIMLSPLAPNTSFRSWQLRMRCTAATIGRLDGWFANSGFGRFVGSPLVRNTRTIGLSATGASCLAVASHVTKTAWSSDLGDQADSRSVIGRSSSFSSLGPTRDGRQKPDISAPGQWITSALARGSEMESDDRFSDDARRLLTIPGTSMAAPMVTGVVALLLQKKKTLSPDQVRAILAASARHDAHTGAPGWNPTYGHGKIDVAAALAGV